MYKPSLTPIYSFSFYKVGCKLDTWNHHWLDLTQDMFVKEGRQTWNCKQTDYTGRRLVADVECQGGYLTVRSCKSNATVG